MKSRLIFHLFHTLLVLVTRVFSSFQVERLRKDIEMQNNKKEGLGARASVAQNKIKKLNSKLEKVLLFVFVRAFVNGPITIHIK